jgi:hypothetical protein
VPCRPRSRHRGRLADVARAGPQHAADADRLGEAVEVDRLVGGDDADLQLAGAAPSRTDEVAQQAGLRAAVVGGQAALADTSAAPRGASRCRLEASRQSSTGSMRSHEPGAWKPQMSAPSSAVPNEYSSLLR